VKPRLRHILFGKFSFLVIAALLFGLSFIFSKLYTARSSVTQETRLLEKYLHNQEKEFDKFIADTSTVRKLLQKKETLREFNRLASKRFGIFLYAANDIGGVYMKFWSDQLALPPQEIFAAEDGQYFHHLSNGYYVTIKRTLTVNAINEKILAIAMIPIRSEFFIRTDYLPHEFAHSKTAEKRVIITDGIVTEFPVKSMSGKTLFYLDKKLSGSAVPYNDRLTIFLRLAGVIFLFLFLHLFAEAIAKRYGAWIAIAALAIIVATLRVMTYYYPALLNLRQFELFDPAIYGSNPVQRSLGDLLVNAALFCWIVLFAWSRLHTVKQLTSNFPTWLKWTAGISSLCLLIYSTFLSSAVIRSIVADSKISFDVTNFASITRYSVFGFLVLAILILSYYYFTQLLFRLIFPLFEGRIVIIYFVIGFAGLTFLTIRSGDPDVLFFLPVLLWLLGYTWLVNRQGLLFNRLRINISGILFWIFVFSISISAIMLSENAKAEWESRKSRAYKQASQTDMSSEYTLSIALEYLDNDFLQENYHRFVDPAKSRQIRDSILTENYSGDKYDTRLYVYDSLNRSVNNDDLTPYEDLNTLLTVQAQPAQTSGLYYYETSFDKFIYITRRNISDTNGRSMGSLFIISNPRNFSSDALFPELFKQFRQNDLESSPIYSYAMYINRRLSSPSNKYPFPIWIDNSEVPKEEFEKRIKGDYDELWYRASNDKVVVIPRKRDTLIETITLFSYIFCSLLFLVFIVQAISFLLKAINNRHSVRKMLQLNIRTQVHSTIIFISIFSFLIIGVSTISFFIGRYERSNTDKLSRTMKIMVNEMQKEQAAHSMFDDVVKIYDTVANSKLQKLVKEVSDIHGVDVNIYDLYGDLKVSSEANVYTKGVLSRKMDPTAYFYLDRYRQVKHSQEEKVGNFSYLSIYAPVRDENGNAQAYINIPYFTSTPELNQEISNFLVTLINLNAFIFLVAGLIALLITNRITRSFSVISDKMREVNLGKLNEEIAWNREDEIGELVKEYNKMVAKLGESATALAKSEREGAWREMARQVAHEIKNPLTPMKLSIQYLQKAINNNAPNVKELSANVANTLVEQIDHLSKIAADFSQFANIGTTNVTRFDLHDVIASLKELYSSDDRVNFEWNKLDREIPVEADKTQMNRLFTNLFANAVEACHGSSACLIRVNEKETDGHILISVKDNGEGIPAEMQSRIFVPNFTTKSSGTGLGLAMCKGIVEQAKGNIWFETEVGQGTIFYVELPLAAER
jgi:two-component system, NtrC family, nitrogen regulation sensor histidine kinase NtrY